MGRNASHRSRTDRTPLWLHPERLIAGLARRQHGVISREQLQLLGFTRNEIQHRARSGSLHRVHRGAFAVGYPHLTWRGQVSAAVLACSLGALASHTTAGAIHGFAEATDPIHVTDIRRHRLPSLTTHVCTGHPADRSLTDGIPVTSPARTLLDLAGSLPRHEFRRAYEEADRLDLVSEQAIRDLANRSPGHRGLSPLLALANETFAHVPTRSELERLFLELVDGAGLPPPLVNVRVEGHLVDACWPQDRLVVELDGRTYHRTDAKVERDYATSAELTLHGYGRTEIHLEAGHAKT